ncbi:MAG: hypothetical protein GF315_15050 [candidate division Zixibacteria bacterium]|nr:hypothetical protein [candidate division Zixibacteria bacterium]
MRLRRIGINIALLVASTVVCLLLVELGLRIFFPQTEPIVWLKNDPELGKVPVKSYEGKHRFVMGHDEINFRINSLGLRGREYDLSDTTGIRILTLGDSYTFGWGVADTETFSYLLEKRLDQESEYENMVFNAGVLGWCTVQEYLYLKRLYPKLHPDIVVVTYLPFDAIQNCSMAYLNPDLRLTWKQWKLPFEDFLADNSHLYRFARKIQKQLYFQSEERERIKRLKEAGKQIPENPTKVDFYTDEEWEKLKEIFDEFFRFCEARDVDLVIQTAGVYSDTLVTFFRNFADQRPRVYYHDLAPVVAGYPEDEIYIPNDRHFTVLGNQLVAKALYGFLVEQELMQ